MYDSDGCSHGSLYAPSGRIDRGDLKNKAKSLELEYRLTELEEKLNQVGGQHSSEGK
ncbi:MAG: hypothetical protein ISS71_00270 [Phycisphaerae bacterium]|nr:hypothetical protein [Phycisphaerae bacterium]